MKDIFTILAENKVTVPDEVKEGIAIAKQNGVYKGRKPIEHPKFREVVAIWKGGEISAVEAMKRLNMKPSTFYRKVKEMI